MGTSMPYRGAWCTYRASRLCEKRDGGSWEVVVLLALLLLALLLLLFLTIFVIFTYCVRKKPAKYLNKHCWVCYPVVLLLFLWCGDDEKAPTGHLLTAAACRVAMVLEEPHFHVLFPFPFPTQQTGFRTSFRFHFRLTGSLVLQVNPNCSRLSSC